MSVVFNGFLPKSSNIHYTVRLGCHIARTNYVCHYLTDDPLVGSIATQFINDRRTHDKIARNWTKRYAQ